jgi:hypothetical protein
MKQEKETNYDLTKLLENDNESFYWVGFLLADGWFSQNSQQMSLEINNKDYDHLFKFKKFVNFKNEIDHREVKTKTSNNTSCRIRFCDKIVVKQIVNKFHIKPNKTYNPPDINDYESNFNKNQILSLIAGYIDGDGSIVKTPKSDKRVFLSIAIHKNWVHILEFFKKYISNRSTIHIWGDMSFLRLGVNSELKTLKTNLTALKLPLLERKWDRIDINHNNSHEKSQNIKIQCLELYNSGKTPKEISQLLNYDLSHTYRIIKKYAIK